MIEPETVLNGTIWEARHPLCWQALIQWINEDQWLILAVPDKAIHGGTCMIAFSHGTIIKTKREVIKLLNEWKAEQIHGATLRMVTPNTEHKFELLPNHIARCMKCGYEQYSALPTPNEPCPNHITQTLEADAKARNQ